MSWWWCIEGKINFIKGWISKKGLLSNLILIFYVIYFSLREIERLIILRVLLSFYTSSINSNQFHFLPNLNFRMNLPHMFYKAAIDWLYIILQTIHVRYRPTFFSMPLPQNLLKILISTSIPQILIINNFAYNRLMVEIFLHFLIYFFQPSR